MSRLSLINKRMMSGIKNWYLASDDFFAQYFPFVRFFLSRSGTWAILKGLLLGTPFFLGYSASFSSLSSHPLVIFSFFYWALLMNCFSNFSNFKVLKMKAIYETMNLCSVDVTQKCLIAECWTPKVDLKALSDALAKGAVSSYGFCRTVSFLQWYNSSMTHYIKIYKLNQIFGSWFMSWLEFSSNLKSILDICFILRKKAVLVCHQ